MVLRKLMGVLCVALIAGTASFAVAGIPDLGMSGATSAAGAVQVSMWSLPDGDGNSFENAFLAGGGDVNAVITVVLKDGLGAFVENYPFEDVTLSCADAGALPDPTAMVPCPGGATADFNSDEFGETEFRTALQSGGWSEANSVISIAGAPLTSGDVAMKHNSSDMSGDGTVNLTDVGMFSPVFYGAYSYGADFNNDADVNLADVGRLAAGYGKSCP